MRTQKILSRILLLSLTFLTLAVTQSCEKVVEFDVEDIERDVVVNALPCTDSIFFANITYSRFFLDNQPFTPVDNATVTLDINGTSTSFTSRDGANYFFGYSATAGDTLTLHVDVPGHPTITGGTRVPALPDMTMPLAELDTLLPFNTAEISFTLTDPIGENYYYIYVLERDSGSRWNDWEKVWDTIDTVIHAYFNCINKEITDPEVNCAEGLMDYYTNLLFSDKKIEGVSDEILLSIMILKDTAEHPLLREYTLVVESLSPEAFRYTKDVLNSQGAASYFAEPAHIYSNLSSQIGIFAGIARRQYSLTFTYKEPTIDRRGKTLKPCSVSMSQHNH
ncbi:MAG: DUF4249 domain-containing protein [Bacteroidales bacterium]|nr:DUF4249 domain-containing protein [Bacteroidales bacterium]